MNMVEEIASNRLTQQDLHEEHPTRLFGQAVEHVESDRIKRAREELVIVELDGPVKRRRIESIHLLSERVKGRRSCRRP